MWREAWEHAIFIMHIMCSILKIPIIEYSKAIESTVSHYIAHLASQVKDPDLARPRAQHLPRIVPRLHVTDAENIQGL